MGTTINGFRSLKIYDAHGALIVEVKGSTLLRYERRLTQLRYVFRNFNVGRYLN